MTSSTLLRKGKPNTSPHWFRNSGWLLSNLKTDAVGAWVLQHQFRTCVSALVCRYPDRSIQMCFGICGAIITSGAVTSRNEKLIQPLRAVHSLPRQYSIIG